MDIKDQFKQDIVTAMKSGDKFTLTVLRTVLGVIQSAEKAGKVEVVFDNQEVQRVLAREVKKRLTTAGEYRNAGVEERAVIEEKEAALLQTYLPKEANVEETERLVKTVLESFDNPTQRDMGTIMKQVNETAQSLGVHVSSKIVSDIVKASFAE